MLIFHKPFTVHFQCVEGHDVKHVTWKAAQGLLPLLTFISGSPIPAHGSCSTLTSPKQINQNDNLSKKHLKWELQDVLVSNSSDCSIESEESYWWENCETWNHTMESMAGASFTWIEVSVSIPIHLNTTCWRMAPAYWQFLAYSKCHVTEYSGASAQWHHEKADKLMAPQEHRH